MHWFCNDGKALTAESIQCMPPVIPPPLAILMTFKTTYSGKLLRRKKRAKSRKKKHWERNWALCNMFVIPVLGCGLHCKCLYIYASNLSSFCFFVSLQFVQHSHHTITLALQFMISVYNERHRNWLFFFSTKSEMNAYNKIVFQRLQCAICLNGVLMALLFFFSWFCECECVGYVPLAENVVFYASLLISTLYFRVSFLYFFLNFEEKIHTDYF